MALTPEIRASQAAVRSLDENAPSARVSQAAVRSLINYPAEFVEASQAAVRNTLETPLDIEVSQAVVRALVFMRPPDKQARAWKFVQDGHEFYILKPGDTRTLVFDRATEQWHHWSSPNKPYWRLRCGLNWNGKAFAGDDTFGVVYRIDPSSGMDESPMEIGVFDPFVRRVAATFQVRGRTKMRLNAVRLTMDLGQPLTGYVGIEMRYSDDYGKSYVSAGTITLRPGDFRQEVMWRSQGVVRPPGRFLVFEDYGASIRIDGVDIDVKGLQE